MSSRTRAVSAGKARSTSDLRVRSSEIDARNFMSHKLLSTCGGDGLAELDQVPVRIPQVAAELTAASNRRGQEVRPARAPQLVYALNVGDAHVQRITREFHLQRRDQGDSRFVDSR